MQNPVKLCVRSTWQLPRTLEMCCETLPRNLLSSFSFYFRGLPPGQAAGRCWARGGGGGIFGWKTGFFLSEGVWRSQAPAAASQKLPAGALSIRASRCLRARGAEAARGRTGGEKHPRGNRSTAWRLPRAGFVILFFFK